MARSPVTRMQLDAYRFGQRRMESALALRDPVPMHEEIRTQRRLVVTGLALAMLGLVAMFGYATLAPQPAWNAQQVVVGRQSGRLFAVIHQPDRLVPVANLAAARLVLYAAERVTPPHPSGAGGSAAAGSVAGGPAAAATPVAVDDTALDAAPRTASAAIPGAAANLPAPDDAPMPAGPWALCDSPGGGDGATTTLIANAGRSAPLGPGDGLLLRGPGGLVYLVIERSKYRIDAPEVRQAYDLRDQDPRPASAALLAAIPDGQPLDSLVISGAGRPSSALPGHAIGEVVRVSASGRPDRTYLVLAGGVQEVSAPVAALIRAGLRADVSQPPDSVRLEQINAAPRVTIPELTRYPAVVPRITDPASAPGVCWQWAAGGSGGTVTTAAAPPLPPGRSVTPLAPAGNPGAELDAVSLPAGGALVVCAVPRDPPDAVPRDAPDAVPGDPPDAVSRDAVAREAPGAVSRGGPGAGRVPPTCPAPPAHPAEPAGPGERDPTLCLVSDTGVAYPIANAETAAALGVASAVPAPAAALRLLPAGPTLDVGQAQRAVDVLVAAPVG